MAGPGVADMAITLSLTIGVIWLAGALVIMIADHAERRRMAAFVSRRARRLSHTRPDRELPSARM